MPGRAEEQKIIAIAGAMARSPSEESGRFLRQFYAHVAPGDVLSRTSEALLADALSLWELAQTRPPGGLDLRIAEGPRPARTVIELVNDDMPFLLDSLSAAITAEGLTLRLAVHPILAVARDGAGRLAAFYEQGQAPPDAAHESMMRLELTSALDAAGRAALDAKLRAVLADVRAATEDWRKMLAALAEAQAALARRPPPVPSDALAQAKDFLGWLGEDYFVFLGARDYRFGAGDAGVGDIVKGSGLGILRADERSVFEGLPNFVDLPAETRAFLSAPTVLAVARASERSRVLRPAPMDAIAVKQFDAEGRAVGLRLFVGLFTWHAYRVNPARVPLLSAKIENVFRRAGAEVGSHDYRALLHVIESLPRDELFQLEEDQLLDMALGIRDLEQQPRVGLFLRRDPFGRFYSCFVFVPRERYGTELRQRFAAILAAALDAEFDSFHVELDDQVLARVLIFLRTPPGPRPAIDVEAIERKLADAARDWSDGLQEALIAAKGDDEAARLFRRYRDAFPSGYREKFPPEAALSDIARIEEVAGGAPFAVAFERVPGAAPREIAVKLFRPKAPMPLSDIVPLLEQLGLRIAAENPFELAVAGATVSYQEFVADSLAGEIEIARDGARLEEAFTRILSGAAEADGFNRLLLAAKLDWREVAVLRLYARFLRQAGTSFSLAYINETLARNGGIAAKLTALFKRRFDPARGDGAAEADRIAAAIETDLDQVASLDDDRILRGLLLLLRQSLRTNFFQTEDGAPKPYLSVKLASAEIDLLPLPRPMVEIFVSAPWMEGVHLRAGKIARGGIRWSDRREDFRTEILGLMKAQVVKNAVIVPTGSKGGFVVKRPPTERDALQKEAERCYTTLLQGMLDLTDNVADDKIVPPPDTVRYDGADPYLVVAADKGTATFSDLANELAIRRGYWLGDAFASGGSEGYDHKAMGITARGAWELVKRHFRERGTDIQASDFTIVGVGDMSGDVFGNGMLQSRHIRLIAAFDHRHIFLDPDPDPTKSFAERERMFKLPRSSWTDYDRAAMSEGGGVYPRTLKSIPLSSEIRKRLDIGATSLEPALLIRAILKAPVDLLWFGGIGTFVKSSRERHADVGDRVNDTVRIDGAEVRAPVIGEGANLGATQLGRIEYAIKGGRIDTDSIDNSAGVDTSDREVNIKIALDALVRAGSLGPEARHKALHELTDEVAALVLADNDAQGLALSLAERAMHERFAADVRLMRDLERRKQLDRAVEFLPEDETLAARGAAGTYLARPELCVLLSYAKNALVDALLATDLPDDPQRRDDLFAYFPPRLVRYYPEAIAAHRLRREIVATVAANDLVNRGGIAFANELVAESGRDAGDVARAFAIARGAFALDGVWSEVTALDNKIDAATQSGMLLAWRRLARLATGWFLRRKSRLDDDADIAAYRPGIAALTERLGEILGEAEGAELAERYQALIAKQVPPALAQSVALLGFLDPALAIVELALALKRDPVETGRAFFATGAKLRLNALVSAARALKPASLWDQRAAESLVEDAFARFAALARFAAEGDGALDRFLASRKNAADRFQTVADELAAAPTPDLARLLVASQALAALAGG
jgi:glutamate dehydrogenase